MVPKPDFSGWATKAELQCADGRTIKTDAFKHMDGKTVPLVWQHGHNDPENILGHVLLEAKDGGLRCHAFFNDTPKGVATKQIVQHGDLKALSIYANKLVERAKQVFHGFVKEVSLTIAGANPGALIDYVNVLHSDGEVEVIEDEAIIHSGLPLEIDVVEHAAGGGKTAQDVYDTLDEDQKNLVQFMLASVISTNSNMAQSDAAGDEGAEGTATGNDDNEGNLTHQEGTTDVTKNVFDQTAAGGTGEKRSLSHADIAEINALAHKKHHTLKSAVEEWAGEHLEHGIENLEILFPDARNVTGTPDFIKRQTDWVAGVLNGVGHTPFSRVKTFLADLTQDEARAKGYIKGTLKTEEWISVTKRTTGPTTVYKKQMLDRDDIIDITDFDVVVWIKAEMRLMLEEEIAVAILIGDGRDPGDANKIKDPAGVSDGIGIRSIVNDHELYTTTVNLKLDATTPDYNDLVEKFLLERQAMKGSGSPTFYTTTNIMTRMLLSKDTYGRRRYNSKAELVATLMVKDIVEVEAMERDATLLGVIVNLADYNVGADKGGEVSLFDDFDIDYNEYKYLIETRISGALVKYKAAMVIRKVASTDTLVTPAAPTFVPSTGVVTIVATTHITYKNLDTGATLSTGAQTALAEGATLNVVAVPDATYYVAGTDESNWSFTRPHA
jgi:hypothetical protein